MALPCRIMKYAMRSIKDISGRAVKIVKKHNHLITALIPVVLVGSFILYYGLPFLGVSGLKSIQLKNKVQSHVLNNCQKEAKKYDWLDCSKLEIEPAYQNEDEFTTYCSDSWLVDGSVRNDKREILWNNTVETDSKGNIRSEEYGSSFHPDNWDESLQNPSQPDFKVDRYMTPSPCSPMP